MAIHALMPRLRQAESEGRILGNITVVRRPTRSDARSIFSATSRAASISAPAPTSTATFPLLDRPDKNALPPATAAATVDARLKRLLVELSVGHDIVLDLHCDDEGVPYLYVPVELWPAMEDCAAAMGVEAVVLWQGSSGAAFEEAAIHPWLQMPPEEAGLDRRVVTTVEFRGQRDVESATADVGRRGHLQAARHARRHCRRSGRPAETFTGIAAPIDNVEMISMPRAGAILFHVEPGQRVEQGARLATIVHSPGEPDGAIEIHAPQAGYILTRTMHRSGRAGDDIIKLVGETRSARPKDGALED